MAPPGGSSAVRTAQIPILEEMAVELMWGSCFLVSALLWWMSLSSRLPGTLQMGCCRAQWSLGPLWQVLV